MALHRSQLSPVHGFDNRIDWPLLMERWNQRAMRWVLGPGFLCLHLAVFGVSLLTAMTWNLIVDPADLSLVDPFRYWGVAAVVHTVLVGGNIIASRYFGQMRPPRHRLAIPASIITRQRPSADAPSPSAWQTAWMRPVEQVAKVNTTARRWIANASRATESAPPPPDTHGGWPERSSPAEEQAPDFGDATWPSVAPRSTALAASANPADEVVSVDHRDADDHTRTWIDAFVESRTKDKDSRWSWVEAAAAAWLNKRDADDSPEKALAAGSPPADAAATPAADETPDNPAPTA